MSYAKTSQKVLRTALKRLQSRWGKGTWVSDEDHGYKVCIEGAICNGQPSRSTVTQPQHDAMLFVQEIIEEDGHASIPLFNDHPDTSLEDVENVMKLAIIRAESGAVPDPKVGRGYFH
jgi:hypothetical protein